MLLTWLASKAGVPAHRAEVLWQAAQRHADRATAGQESAEYWSIAMDRLHWLMAAESLREDAASFGWRRWTRLNNRLWQAPLTVLDALTLNNERGWRSFRPLSLG
jgi:hypothetical protein